MNHIGAGGGGGGCVNSTTSTPGGGGGGGYAGTTAYEGGTETSGNRPGSDSFFPVSFGLGGWAGDWGGGGSAYNPNWTGAGYPGSMGLVRIIWSTSGAARAFPSTNIGDLT